MAFEVLLLQPEEAGRFRKWSLELLLLLSFGLLCSLAFPLSGLLEFRFHSIVTAFSFAFERWLLEALASVA